MNKVLVFTYFSFNYVMLPIIFLFIFEVRILNFSIVKHLLLLINDCNFQYFCFILLRYNF